LQNLIFGTHKYHLGLARKQPSAEKLLVEGRAQVRAMAQAQLMLAARR
jgi:DNA primase